MTMHSRKPQIKADDTLCPVQDDLPCLVPDQRKKLTRDWTLNMPNILAVLGLLFTLATGLLYNENRMTKNEQETKNAKEEIEKVKEQNKRDRGEMRDDIKIIQKDTKETKEMIIKLVERRH